jgi:AcrR family transcriptional regulator
MVPIDQSFSSGSRTRKRLVDAGQALFGAQGYAATSMRQVAEKTGLALGGIYNHFSSKEAIFKAILLEQNPFTRSDLLPLSENFDRQRAKILLDEMEKQPEIFNIILIELVEFKGQHLPKLFENIFDGLPPSKSWRILLSLIISHHITQILLASIEEPGLQLQISPDAFIDFILKGSLESE